MDVNKLAGGCLIIMGIVSKSPVKAKDLQSSKIQIEVR